MGPLDVYTRCAVCSETFAPRALDSHIVQCLVRRTAASSRPPVDTFHLAVSGESPPTGATYWIHVLARAGATLFDLDGFLRRTWLEPCCGHLSAFESGAIRFEPYPDDEYGPPAEDMRTYRLGDVLVPGKKYAYEYDFGSTTHLEVRVIARPKVAVKGRARFELLARNPPPALACGACGEAATRVCTVGCDAPEALACAACAADHACGEDMLTTIVNSPRTGTCGYPTEPLEGASGGWVAAR